MDNDLKSVLIQELDYITSPGFRTSLEHTGRRSIPGIDNIYFINDTPLIYFSQFNNNDPNSIWKLYRQVWSQGKVPILCVILPEEIRIYNSYAEPSQTPEELNTENRLLQNLSLLVDIATARKKIRDQLYGQYNRFNLETGAFWNTPDGKRIKRENRADQRLLKAMNQVRIRLMGENLSSHLAYALIGRSIFIRYLEDRGILTADVESQLAGKQITDYCSGLQDWNTTYSFFAGLSRRFNGDLFPINDGENERAIVKQKHLDILKAFLEGYDFDLEQPSFWPYDFSYIPIELISGIYDTFLYSSIDQKDDNDNDKFDDDREEDANATESNVKDKTKIRRSLGAYYTPLSLVDFVIDETIPLDDVHSNMTILDPACGSGIFLVRAYQRLVEAWSQEHHSIPSAKILSEILKRNIFGVDIELNAIRIAAFSLYLAMLDHLKNDEILEEKFRFPNLKDTNLIHANFFSKDVEKLFADRKFSRIIGNLPWGRGTLKDEALIWVEKHKYQIGNRQIAQAFLVYAPKFCAEDGELALLAPAKSTIFVSSDTHETFRKQFFQEYTIRALVNFSALVYELFVSSLSPAVALFYKPGTPPVDSKLIYGVPKPSPISQHLGAIVLDSTEIKYLDREELQAYPFLWKVAAWGTYRDASLIKRLNRFPKLKHLEAMERNLLRSQIHEGYVKPQKGKKSYKVSWLTGKPYTDTNKFREFVVDIHGSVDETSFERFRNEEIFKAPLVLIRKSTCQASYLDEGFVAYRNMIIGVAGQPGQEKLLKWLVAYINSPLAKYYHFLTSNSWAVERGRMILDEYRNMPFLMPQETDPHFQEVLFHVDKIIELCRNHDVELFTVSHTTVQHHKDAIAELVFDLYGLTQVERQLVDDIVNYEIDFFNWSKRKNRKISDSKAKAVRPPNHQILEDYVNTFTDTANTFLHYQDQTLVATVYYDSSPLTVVDFELLNMRSDLARPLNLVKSSKNLQDILRVLDHLLIEQRTSTLYMRRHVRIYNGSHLYFVRPSERRFWTRSQARADADSFIMELLTQPAEEHEVEVFN